jgi:hypothetical protein
MKKTFFALMATLFISSLSYANNELAKKNSEEKKNSTIEKTIENRTKDSEKEAVCTISCSVTVNGVTYTTSAGGWLTSCKEAGNQCLRKLAELSANLEP